MLDLGPGSGRLADRFVSGTSVRVRALAVATLAAILAALTGAWTAAVTAAIDFVGWLITSPWFWWARSVREIATSGVRGRLFGNAIGAAIGSIQGLGPLAYPAGMVSVLALWAVGSLAWRWLV